MLAVQSMPCRQMETVLTSQPGSLNEDVCVNEQRTLSGSDLGILDQSSVIYFKYLLKKYKRRMGDEEVSSGGLQQFLIKQKDRKQREKSDKESYDQGQSLFEQLPVDVRLHIFSYLTATNLCKVSRVCRSWYDITEDNLLWAGLMERDLPTWNQIGHNTNPAIYKEVESDWSNKQIYLRCSPEVNQLMHQQNAMFSNITNMLRYFFPKKTPMFAMFGPGLETNTSGIVRKIIHESEFQCSSMFPGKFDGVGGGFTLKSPAGSSFHLSVMYSASRKEREQNGDREQRSKLMRQNKNTTDDEKEKYELVPAVQDFCKTVDGFVYVVDATLDKPAVESGLSELQALVSERWSATHVPVLVLSVVSPMKCRVPCCEIVTRLNLAQLNRPWRVRDCQISTLEGVSAGFQWLSEQSQRR